MSEEKLFGFCLGDGWISRSKQSRHSSYYYQVGFSGDKLSLVNHVKPDLEAIFGDIGKATIRTDRMVSEKYGISGTTSQFIANTKVAKRFVELGMVPGQRVSTIYEIPRWIMKGETQTKRDFLSGYYAAEGFTPKFQDNGKTLRTLGFRYFKRKSQEENKDLLVSQWSQLLEDLGIEFTYEETMRTTVEDNYVCTFIFSNSHDQILHQLSILELEYSLDKEEIAREALKYYKAKDRILENLRNAHKYSIENRDVSATQIAEEYKINRDAIYQWRSRGTGVQIPKNFMTFEQFKLSLT